MKIRFLVVRIFMFFLRYEFYENVYFAIDASWIRQKAISEPYCSAAEVTCLRMNTSHWKP